MSGKIAVLCPLARVQGRVTCLPAAARAAGLSVMIDAQATGTAMGAILLVVEVADRARVSALELALAPDLKTIRACQLPHSDEDRPSRIGQQRRSVAVSHHIQIGHFRGRCRYLPAHEAPCRPFRDCRAALPRQFSH
jgi:hypothetical protein